MATDIAYTLLHCSGELRKEMTGGGQLPINEARQHVFDHWYAQLLLIDKRNCVLFSHGSSFYSVLAIAQSRARIAALRHLFTDTLKQALRNEKIGDEAQQHLLRDWQAIAYARSGDPRMNSAMQEIAKWLRLEISRLGGVLSCPIEQINYDLNRCRFDFAPDTAAAGFSRRFALELSPLYFQQREAELKSTND